MTPTDNNLGHAPGGDDDAHPIFANAPNNPSLWGTRSPRAAAAALVKRPLRFIVEEKNITICGCRKEALSRTHTTDGKGTEERELPT